MTEFTNRTEKSNSGMRKELLDVKEHISTLDNFFNKIELTLDKITDIQGDMNKMIAVHDNILATHTKEIENITRVAELRRTETDKKTQEILDKLSALRDELKRYQEKDIKETRDMVDKRFKESQEQIEKLQVRLDSVERWRFMVIGAAIAIGWLISKIFSIASIL